MYSGPALLQEGSELCDHLPAELQLSREEIEDDEGKDVSEGN